MKRIIMQNIRINTFVQNDQALLIFRHSAQTFKNVKYLTQKQAKIKKMSLIFLILCGKIYLERGKENPLQTRKDERSWQRFTKSPIMKCGIRAKALMLNTAKDAPSAKT